MYKLFTFVDVNQLPLSSGDRQTTKIGKGELPPCSMLDTAGAIPRAGDLKPGRPVAVAVRVRECEGEAANTLASARCRSHYLRATHGMYCTLYTSLTCSSVIATT